MSGCALFGAKWLHNIQFTQRLYEDDKCTFYHEHTGISRFFYHISKTCTGRVKFLLQFSWLRRRGAVAQRKGEMWHKRWRDDETLDIFHCSMYVTDGQQLYGKV